MLSSTFATVRTIRSPLSRVIEWSTQETRRFRMFTKIDPRSGFARVGRILTALVIMLSLGAFASPAPSLAADETLLIMRVHVTNYQHGNNLQGAIVHAIGTSVIDQYSAVTGRDGIALLKVRPGLYEVTVRIASLQPLYEPCQVSENGHRNGQYGRCAALVHPRALPAEGPGSRLCLHGRSA